MYAPGDTSSVCRFSGAAKTYPGSAGRDDRDVYRGGDGCHGCQRMDHGCHDNRALAGTHYSGYSRAGLNFPVLRPAHSRACGQRGQYPQHPQRTNARNVFRFPGRTGRRSALVSLCRTDPRGYFQYQYCGSFGHHHRRAAGGVWQRMCAYVGPAYGRRSETDGTAAGQISADGKVAQGGGRGDVSGCGVQRHGDELGAERCKWGGRPS